MICTGHCSDDANLINLFQKPTFEKLKFWPHEFFKIIIFFLALQMKIIILPHKIDLNDMILKNL